MSDAGADAWGTGDMQDAVNDINTDMNGGGGGDKDVTYEGRPKEDEDAKKRAREHGYKERVDYNYTERTTTRKVAKNNRCDWIATGEIGIVAPRNPDLEAELFSADRTYGKGLHIDILEKVDIKAEGEDAPKPVGRFEAMGLHPVLLETLKLSHYLEPTAIQKYVMPAVLELRDMVVSAVTGSGKTVAYMAPIISHLMGRAHHLCAPKWNPARFNPMTDAFRAEPLVLIILPTRELAWQVFDECRSLCYRSGLRPCVAYGGGPMAEQREELLKGCDILIATPGRLKDFLRNPRILSLHRTKFTVIDEADELMQEDWVEEIGGILSGANLNEDSDHIFMMFSATFPAKYRHVAKKYMAKDFLRIKAGRCGASHANIKQKVLWVDGNRKNEALYDVLFAHPPGRTIIFCNSKPVADKIDDFLYNADLPSASLHSDRTQNEREDAIAGFRTGEIPILVTTGVAARGIDVPHILHVINYDLPSTQHGGIEEYVHRIGRTGRLGHMGLATSFYNDRNDDLAEALVKILMETNQEIPDFLESFKPMDGKLEFEEGDSDAEDDDGFGAAPAGGDAGDAAGDGWGGGGDAPAETNGDDAGGAWGAGGDGAADEDSGFKADDAADTGASGW